MHKKVLRFKKKLFVFLIIVQIFFFPMVFKTISNFSTISFPTFKENKNLILNTNKWSEVSIISDDATGWNDGLSERASIAVDNNGDVHVVWYDDTNGEWGSDTEIMYARLTATGWSNATVISDDTTGWNKGFSYDPSIAIDDYGNIHVVWWDGTVGEWGGGSGDSEIMYTNCCNGIWSNATVISDNTGWNDGVSEEPDIAVDDDGNLHVVWQDNTISLNEWGFDKEIMYSRRTASGWSNATVISDDSTRWNGGASNSPSIAVDCYGIVHVVWEDDTNGEWGSDREIMYSQRTAAGWSNATVISDDKTLWNNGNSDNPGIAVDKNGDVHVVWYDATDGEWGSDSEIMYSRSSALGWSTIVLSDDLSLWNNGDSYYPNIAIDNDGNVHVVWHDATDGEWGIDWEIMYIKSSADGWSNATVISDDNTGWNNDTSYYPDVATDSDGNVYVVWNDETNGDWGTDREIMYSKNSFSSPGESINYMFIPTSSPDILTYLTSPLGLGIIGTVVAISVIISVIISKKRT